jgi:murein DD-endopeptidase MepM/ murein hydrolase activator NlpD
LLAAARRSRSDALTRQAKVSRAHAVRDQLDQARTAERARVAKARRAKAAALRRAHRWVLPVHGFRHSSDFGQRWGRLHAGDDLAARTGSPVGALTTGVVVFAGQQSGYGNKVEIRHWDGTVSCYGHLSAITAHVGEPVSPGERVGRVGSTGHSTGPHLHLEVHPDGGGAIDPEPFLARRGVHY